MRAPARRLVLGAVRRGSSTRTRCQGSLRRCVWASRVWARDGKTFFCRGLSRLGGSNAFDVNISELFVGGEEDLACAEMMERITYGLILTNGFLVSSYFVPQVIMENMLRSFSFDIGVMKSFSAVNKRCHYSTLLIITKIST